ncbi:MAG: NifU family protein [Gemmatimonadota bacterium]
MITLTDRARARLTLLIDQLDDDACLRLSHAGGSPLAPDYDLAIVDLASRTESDRLVDAEGISVLLGEDSGAALTVDFVDGQEASGFQVRRTAAAGVAGAGTLAERVQRVIDERVNPGVAAHGGKITLHEVRDDVALIEMSGGCQGCTLSQMTLRRGVERMIREAVPEILGVHDVTDHTSGDNPFYTA